MANNTFLTPRMAGIMEQPMADAAAESQKYPAYRFHATLPMICVQDEAEEKALPTGYRDRPYTEEEADAYVKAEAAKADEGETPTRRSHR